MSTRRLLAVSIDLDGLDLYLGLYGATPPALLDAEALALIPGRAAQRFGELCDRLGIKGTLFVVGRDLERNRGHAELRALHAAGHEIASHSFAHDYALTRRTPEEIHHDLAQAEEQIIALTGTRPVGFRAPGYTLSRPLLELLRARGYLYDSSLLPSPAYYAAKAAVIGALALTGRASQSILGGIAQLARSREPHVEAILELPVCVLPGVRVPFIGTLITTTPSAISLALARTLDADELVVLELHGIDLCDASDDIPAALLARQRDLQVPLKTKLTRLEAVLRALLRDREALPLAACAPLVSAALSE